MIRINLLSEGRRPVVARKSKAKLSLGDQDPSVLILAAGLIVGLLAAGGLWYVANSKLKDVQEQVAQANREVAELQSILDEVEEFKAKKVELQTKIDVIQDLKRNQRGPVLVMDEVSRALPDLLWLDSLKMNTSTVSVKGMALNTNAVATFIENLGDVETFREPTTKDVARKRDGEPYRFDMTFAYFTPLPPEPVEASEDNEDLGIDAEVPR
ncbi:MAG: PilN domain-containing protein [Acidobacteriota bacterium]